MKKIGHKIFFLLILSILLSSAGGAYLALKGFVGSKEDELLEKNAQIVLAVASLATLTKDIRSPILIQAISSYPLFGVGVVDLHSNEILVSNGGLKLEKVDWQEVEAKKSSAAVFSRTLEKNFLSVAVLDDDRLAVVATTPRTTVFPLIKQVYSSYLWLLSALTILLGFLGYLVSRAIVRPIEELTVATESFAQGRWEIPLRPTSDDEIGALSRSFIKMGQSLQEREKTIQDKNQELAVTEKLATMGQFSAGIAHEIKNPLAAISTHLQLLQRDDSLSSKVMEKLELLMKEVGRANRIITDILNFSRQEHVQLLPMPLAGFIQGLFADLQPLAQSRQADIEIAWQGSKDGKVEVDNERMHQVFANLLSNSLDALEAKSGLISWRVEVGADVRIHIQDNGPGITEQFQSKIFDPFFTSKPAGKGTGLGLSVCHGIIKQHSGKLSYLPSKSGAHFLIVLPLI